MTRYDDSKTPATRLAVIAVDFAKQFEMKRGHLCDYPDMVEALKPWMEIELAAARTEGLMEAFKLVVAGKVDAAEELKRAR